MRVLLGVYGPLAEWAKHPEDQSNLLVKKVSEPEGKRIAIADGSDQAKHLVLCHLSSSRGYF